MAKDDISEVENYREEQVVGVNLYECPFLRSSPSLVLCNFLPVRYKEHCCNTNILTIWTILVD